MIRRFLAILTVLMLSACATASVKTGAEGIVDVKAKTLGQATVTAEPDGSVVVEGGTISQIFGGVLKGIIELVPFGKQPAPEININVPAVPE